MDQPAAAIQAIARALRDAPAAPSSDLDLNPGWHDLYPPDRPLRPAAVLVPILRDGGQGSVILTRRSARLAQHPGQVAFPGGKVDAADASPEAAALREAGEEIGLPPAAVTLLGALPTHDTVTGYRVTPFVGVIDGPFTPRPEAGEVDEVFGVPLAHVLDPANYTIHQRLWRGRPRRYHAAPWGPHYIWGATARMLLGLALRIGPA
jgi:8-oxo-dGTP pyrophosphatase MutT (NUDIX family)